MRYITIKAFDEYKAWEDNTYASSCEGYRYPKRFHNYIGDVIYLFLLLFLLIIRLEAEFIGYRLRIIFLMFIAIWKQIIMDTQVTIYKTLFLNKGILQRKSENPIRIDF